ncbi:MAG: 30S ribosome-binding factor RbfA [Clostridiales bacterium]|jgi:ribosome-binding factor A|nr:30S ribosome-binding factor RbfA [Clostridiales bacterium]
MDRTVRIAAEMKKVLSEFLLHGIKDPRLPLMTSITDVKVTRDLKYAKVYVSVLGDKAIKDNAMEALKSASGYLRSELGKQIKMRYMPELNFYLDESIERGVRINDLINKTIAKEREK